MNVQYRAINARSLSAVVAVFSVASLATAWAANPSGIGGSGTAASGIGGSGVAKSGIGGSGTSTSGIGGSGTSLSRATGVSLSGIGGSGTSMSGVSVRRVSTGARR